MKNILVVGGSGYVGSRLRQVLTQNYNVDSVDCCWYRHDSTSRRIDYNKLTADDLTKYSTVILLAGHSSVASCNGNIQSPWLNNVTNFTNLLSKLPKSTTIIYASSASVYSNRFPGTRHSETSKQFTPVNNYDITKYTLDLHAQLAIAAGHTIIGLRFGTVNGWSPNLRVDVMINAMYTDAVLYNEIIVTNKKINRALLGIEDLCRGICCCIENPSPGIYNMASFNTTVSSIATTLATKLNVPIRDKGHTLNVYDFELDTTLFEQTFNFTFIETPATIIDGLIEKYNSSIIGRRDKYMQYQWESEYEIRQR